MGKNESVQYTKISVFVEIIRISVVLLIGLEIIRFCRLGSQFKLGCLNKRFYFLQ